MTLREGRLNDSEFIDRELEKVLDHPERMPDAVARMIASQWHGGQSSALYSFASTGALVDACNGVMLEIERCQPQSRQDRVHLSALYRYCDLTPDRGPVAGWSNLWVNE